MRPRPVRIDAATLERRAARVGAREFRGAARGAAADVALASLDLTTLEGSDTPARVRELCAFAAAPGPGAPRAAAVCLYPSLVPVARAALAGTGVRIAAVATGFPSGLVPTDVKLREVRAAVALGADEIDMVIDRGAFLAGRHDEVRDEIARVRDACDGARLKVILEAGELGSYGAIRRACDLALDAGADFLKNATGKIAAVATPAIALVLCEAVRAHARRTGRRVGVKFAGGIRTTREALRYVAIVDDALGGDWLDPSRFRLGASALAHDLARARTAPWT